jgi:uncharacterized protein (UPF0335 family)
MIKKNGLFAFLKQLGLFGSYIVDDEGAGAGDIDDIGDIDIDDISDDTDPKDGGEPNPKDGEDQTSTGGSEDIEALRKQIEELQADKEARESAEAQNQAIAQLQNQYDGFDSKAVKDYLVELNKTDPEKAESLNNQVGWENVWLTQIAPKVNNDVVSFGRNVPPVDRTEEVLEKVNNGTVTFADEQDVLGKLLG